MQMQIVDCCVGYLITKHFSTPSTTPLLVTQIEEEVKFLFNVIRYEFIEKLKQKPIAESVNNRIKLLQELGEVVVLDGAITKTLKKPVSKKEKRSTVEAFSFLNFFNKMGMHMMDSYLIILMAVMEICNGSYEVKEESLVTELHKMIIMMHNQSLILNLQSCLKETITTGLSRFVKLALLDSKSHPNQNGGRTNYVQSAIANKPQIEAMINKLLEFKSLSEEEFSIWGERISEAVENSLIVYISAARL